MPWVWFEPGSVKNGSWLNNRPHVPWTARPPRPVIAHTHLADNWERAHPLFSTLCNLLFALFAHHRAQFVWFIKNLFRVSHCPWRKFCRQDLASLALFIKIPENMFVYKIVYPFGLLMLAFFMAYHRFIIISILIHFRKVFLRTKKTETRRDRFIHKTFFSSFHPRTFLLQLQISFQSQFFTHNAQCTKNKKTKTELHRERTSNG